MKRCVVLISVVLIGFPVMAEDFNVQQLPDAEWGPEKRSKVVNVSKKRKTLMEALFSREADFAPAAKKNEKEDFFGWRRENKQLKPVLLNPVTEAELPQFLIEPKLATTLPDNLEIE